LTRLIAYTTACCYRTSRDLQLFSRYCALSVLGSPVWPFRVTWRHWSRDHFIPHRPFLIGGPFEPSLYL